MPNPSSVTPVLRLSDLHAEAILGASLDAIFVMHADGRFLDLNSAAEAMLGCAAYDVIGRPVADLILPENARVQHRADMAEYLATGICPIVGQRVEIIAVRASGAEFPAEMAIIPVPEIPPVFIVFLRDISEQKKAQAHSAFLLNELAHRSKNLLAVVQSIINRTLRDHPHDSAREIIANRIGALARSHASLAADPSGAPLRKIVTEELEAFSNHIVVEGPDIMLNASAAQTAALIVHELATNAVKYGALSRATGAVHVRWRSGGGATPFLFEWCESGGPDVIPPTRSGFGRVVLEKIAAAEFNTTPSVDFQPDGLVYRLGSPATGDD